MSIYIAGPMSGYEGMNFDAFNTAADDLRYTGWEVINPVDINPDPNADWKECMIKDIEALIHCEAMYMLIGWQESKGATLEHTIGSALGLDMYYEEDDYKNDNNGTDTAGNDGEAESA
jgi:hypothetical protein